MKKGKNDGNIPRNPFSRVLIVISLSIGLVGYGYYYYRAPKATGLVSNVFYTLYSTIRQYTFSFDADFSRVGQLNLLDVVIMFSLYFAFVLSAFITGFTLYTLLRPFFAGIRTRIMARRANSIALHGSSAIISVLEQNLDGYCVIDGSRGSESLKAKEHIVAFDHDEDALDFLRRNSETMCGEHHKQPAKIYLCIQTPGLGITHDSTVKVSCISENCARLYWEKYYLPRFGRGLPQAADSAHERRSKVVIIGFDKYGQSILYQALSVNVFLTGTPGVEYHVFGDGKAFLRKYPELENVADINSVSKIEKDSIFFYDRESYISSADVISGSDRLIIVSDDDIENYEIFTALCSLYTSLPPIYVRLKTDIVMETLYCGREETKKGDALYNVEVSVFGTDAELYSKDIIINDSLLERAKAIDGWYRKRYRGTAGWEEIGTTKQLSNISAADHASVKLRQFLGEDIGMTPETLARYKEKLALHKDDAEYMYRFMELEHERWRRFYYLHNWKYDENRNDAERKHNCLKPFDQLPEEIRANDLDSYFALGEQ